MKFILALLLSFTMLGCSTVKTAKRTPPQPLKKGLSKQFDVYLRLFATNAMVYGELPINYVQMKQGIRIYMSDNMEDLNESILGLCARPEDKMEIYINAKAWRQMSSLERELLMFHELGHCWLDLDHDASRTKNGTPKSIMHPSDQDSTMYIRHYKYYNKQLFTMYWEQMLERHRKKNVRKPRTKLHILRKDFFKRMK